MPGGGLGTSLLAIESLAATAPCLPNIKMEMYISIETKSMRGFSSGDLGQLDAAYAVSPDGQTIWRGTPWVQVGGSAAEFVVAETLYALSPDRQASWRWTGQGTNWDKVGGAADSIVGTYI